MKRSIAFLIYMLLVTSPVAIDGCNHKRTKSVTHVQADAGKNYWSSHTNGFPIGGAIVYAVSNFVR